MIGGEICIAGRAPGVDFQRGTAYCEQQDVHEWTATVREALRFSAHLRQPRSVSIEDKNAYVEEVIQLLEMEDIADGELLHHCSFPSSVTPTHPTFVFTLSYLKAMIGFPGFGLGVEARKRVTIGVELAAKPQLLLFLDGVLTFFVCLIFKDCESVANPFHSSSQSLRQDWMDKVHTTSSDS